MDCATPHVELPEAVVDECVKAIQEEGPMMPYLPPGIISDILLRLPAECIFHFPQQNDFLCHLTRTAYFKRAHLDRSTPDIVVQSLHEETDSNIKLFLFDGKNENVSTSLVISSFNEYLEGPIDLWSSYEGFLIFKSRYSLTPILCILNPITQEQLILTSPCSLCYVCGFYFHPLRKEYEVIYVDDAKQIWELQILSLRSKHRRSVGRCSYPPSRERWPVFINGIFYWMVNASWYLWKTGDYPILSESLISFNIETEELRTIEAVIPSSGIYPADTHQKLFDLEGDLCLFDTSSPGEVVLRVFNYSTERWNKKQSIPSPDNNEHHWEFHKYFTDVEYIQTKREFIAYYYRWDGEKPSYIYNLRLGTWKLLERTGFEDYKCTAAVNYTPSLVYMNVADPIIPL